LPTYLVLKRINEDRIYEEGEVLVDPPFADSADLLIKRGYLQIVPDNYKQSSSPKAAATKQTAAASKASDKPAKGAAQSAASSADGNTDDALAATGAEAKPSDEVVPGELPKSIDLTGVEAEGPGTKPDEENTAPGTSTSVGAAAEV
jgi:hypothetical protein